MPLETAQYIDSLNPQNPTGDDPVAQADDHIRMLKQVLQATFPNVKAPITLDAPTLNGYLVPKGLISMWSGALNALPAGWFLCNGQNGTPNLTDRFIVGAGLNYAVGTTGGAVTANTSANGAHGHSTDTQGWHSHGGSTAGHVLSLNEIPSHTHGWRRGTGNDGPEGGIGRNIAEAYTAQTDAAGGGAAHSHDIYGDGSHSHNVSWQGDHAHSVDTRSPFYALAFIMKG